MWVLRLNLDSSLDVNELAEKITDYVFYSDAVDRFFIHRLDKEKYDVYIILREMNYSFDAGKNEAHRIGTWMKYNLGERIPGIKVNFYTVFWKKNIELLKKELGYNEESLYESGDEKNKDR